MAASKGNKDELAPIIVKKIKKGGGGHHGGAWKVAYADFVTAMMAFFLLLWLLNVTTKEQKAGLADYFDPVPKITTTSQSGAGGMLGGLSISKEGAMVTEVQQVTTPADDSSPTLRAEDQISDDKFLEEARRRENENFRKAEGAIKQEIANNPELKELGKNLMIDMTGEGLRIQIVDQDGEPMFPSGSAQMYEKTAKLMGKVAEVIRKMPNEVSVRGHTDGVPYSKGASYTNWELSTERANASRQVLIRNGLPEKRLNNVVGKADRDHLIANDPKDARNRRISIILLRDELTVQVGANRSTEAVKKAEQERRNPQYRRTKGEVEFP